MKCSIRKIISVLLLSALLLCQLGGCGKNKGTEGDNSHGDNSSDENTFEHAGMFLDAEDMPWKDNSLDAYSAVVNAPLRYETPENELAAGIIQYFLDDSHAGMFLQHSFEEEDGTFITKPMLHLVGEGGESSTLDLSSADFLDRAFAACGIPGTDHYLVLNLESSSENSAGIDKKCHFFEIDTNKNILRDFYADFGGKGEIKLPYEMQVDGSGNIHLRMSEYNSDRSFYYILSSDGKLLTQYDDLTGFACRLLPLYDGRVALRQDQKLQYVNPSNGKTEKLAEPSITTNYVTLLDERTLLYADTKGLYTCKLSGGDPTPLYIWFQHGIAASDVLAIRVTADQRIDLIYQDANGANYLALKPTTEQVERKKIVFAVFSSRKESYEAAVTEFNRKYPAYHIELREADYKNSALLTQLVAGEGPVLYDAQLMGFEENKEYWEPLDEVYSQMGLENELIGKAMDIGRIDGSLYGITDSFTLETVLTLDNSIRDWDYDAFLDYLEKDPSIEIPFGHSSYCYGLLLVNQFFVHSLDDSYLFDAESRSTRFDSDEFRRILALGKKCTGQSADYHNLLDGTTPCYAVSIEGPECIALFRNTLSGNANYIGYPSQNGSRHYLRGGSTLTVRASATDEEKIIAHTFLKTLLSYETQLRASASDLNFGLSVREDVLEEQIKAVDIHTTGFASGYGWMMFEEDDLDNEADGAVLRELIEKAVPYPTLPQELNRILIDELDSYFEENADAERTIKNLENRVGLYLKER